MIPPYSISFDSATMRHVRQFANWKQIADPIFQSAMKFALMGLQSDVRTSMRWKNPTGALEMSIEKHTLTPYRGVVGTNSVYGPRREFGFTGKTDRLGRYFKKDPGGFYMKKGHTRNKAASRAIFEKAAFQALQKLAA